MNQPLRVSVSYPLAKQYYVYLINELFKINLATNKVHGGVSEWSMVTVLKTVLVYGERGFESHPLRHLLFLTLSHV